MNPLDLAVKTQCEYSACTIAAPYQQLEVMKIFTILGFILVANNFFLNAQPLMDTVSFDVVPKEIRQVYLSEHNEETPQYSVIRGISVYELTTISSNRITTLGFTNEGEYLYTKEPCKLDTIRSVNMSQLRTAFQQLGVKEVSRCFCERRPNSANTFVEIYYMNAEGNTKYLPMTVNRTE